MTTIKKSNHLLQRVVEISNQIQESTKMNASTTISTIGPVIKQHDQHNGFGVPHFLLYIVLPIMALTAIILLAFVAILCIRKLRLDKLRHRLMPLYQFDPADTERDWEIDLLEDDRDQQQQQRHSGSMVA